MTTSFGDWFAEAFGRPPYPWQSELGTERECRSRLIRIPTGFGKTLGVLSAWAFHRLERNDAAWPRRLIWCLPMRVLVEQTQTEVEQLFRRQERLWDGKADHVGKVGVHVVMGGADSGEWHLYPEENAVLIGTQDMLLSRALNRGYAAPRARWPMEFGLLNHDALWIMDEVQLMDVGLATSSQLQAFREHRAAALLRPCPTWWMSATLQSNWLETADTASLVRELPHTLIEPEARAGRLWDDVSKPCRIEKLDDAKRWAALVADAHMSQGKGKLTLLVINTVDRAVEFDAELRKLLTGSVPDEVIHLVHSRFRPAERQDWLDQFLRRDAPIPDAGRIVVATQVVEAGVDLDASLLFTELAPWPSLVQRFGRAARGGGQAQVVVFDRDVQDDKQAAPYTLAELDAARAALQKLSDVAPLHLERFEEQLPREALYALYPYDPQHLLLRREWDELFDTTPDLTGADLDISRFIRSGEERDVRVFWVDLPRSEPTSKETPAPKLQPSRDALCAVPFLKAQEWLCAGGSKRLAPNKRAWVWDWLSGEWRACTRSEIVPGRVLLVSTDSGGYRVDRGWDPKSKTTVPAVASDEELPAHHMADSAQDAEELSAYAWKTVATHGMEVAALVQQIARVVGLDERQVALLALAGRWHDYGKSHPAFQGSIRSEQRPRRQDLAKAPSSAWAKANRYRYADSREYRPGFRHELASTLALFAVLQRYQPTHSALLGPWVEALEALGEQPVVAVAAASPTACESQILQLSADDFDLVAYLVASHHGKVRCALHAAPDDQHYLDHDGRELPIRGLREGDVLPSIPMEASVPSLPELTLTLNPAAAGLSPVTGASWAERVLRLISRFGPGPLGYLEACLRAADIRASRNMTPDPLLTKESSE